MAATLCEMTTDFQKLDHFLMGGNFIRWQRKMHILLTTLNIVYVLTDARPEENENDDYVYMGCILNVGGVHFAFPISSTIGNVRVGIHCSSSKPNFSSFLPFTVHSWCTYIVEPPNLGGLAQHFLGCLQRFFEHRGARPCCQTSQPFQCSGFCNPLYSYRPARYTPFRRGIKPSGLIRKDLMAIIKRRKIDLAENRASLMQDILSHMMSFTDENGRCLPCTSQVISALYFLQSIVKKFFDTYIIIRMKMVDGDFTLEATIACSLPLLTTFACVFLGKDLMVVKTMPVQERTSGFLTMARVTY
ncbi:hypothetical protein SLEP1_g36025 [Rubroshorea leprosula]|uniref:Uncharacterized protein n=1 Tax=Rubroshorea leprosula TaxID=152421 RepID=A0AAV5KQ51_9ROSI|nr:hypothetical protein SLEP1_g36025 [Rubroshorea leprosula]